MARALSTAAVAAAALTLASAADTAGASAWDVAGWSDVAFSDGGRRGLLALEVDRPGQALLIHRSEEALPPLPPARPVSRPITPTQLHPLGGAWTSGPAEAAAPAVASLGDEGRMLAVEVDGGLDRPLSVKVRRGRDGRWDAPRELLGRPAGTSRIPLPAAADLASDGQAIVAVAAGGELLAFSSTLDGGWGPAAAIAGPGAQRIQTLLSDAGDALVVWSRPTGSGAPETVSRRRTPEGRWLPVRRLLAGAPSEGVRVALSEDGRALAAWSARGRTRAASSAPGNGLWRQRRLWADEPRVDLMDLGVDGAGRGVLLAANGGTRRGLLKASFASDRGWREGGLVPGTRGQQFLFSRTRLAVGELGHAIAVSALVLQGDTTGSVRIARRSPAGRWAPARTVGRLDQLFLGEPLVAVNAAGDAAAAWAESASNSSDDGQMAYSAGAEQPTIVSAAARPRSATVADVRLGLGLSRPGFVLLGVHRPGQAGALAGAVVRAGARRVSLPLPVPLRGAMRRAGAYELSVATGAREGAPAQLARRVPVRVLASSQENAR